MKNCHLNTLNLFNLFIVKPFYLTTLKKEAYTSSKNIFILYLFFISKKSVVPGGGFEPPQAICPPAPQAGASTYSAIPAFKRQYIV